MNEVRYLYAVLVGAVTGLIMGAIGIALSVLLGVFLIKSGLYVASAVLGILTAGTFTVVGFVLGFRDAWNNYHRHKRRFRRFVREVASWFIE